MSVSDPLFDMLWSQPDRNSRLSIMDAVNNKVRTQVNPGVKGYIGTHVWDAVTSQVNESVERHIMSSIWGIRV